MTKVRLNYVQSLFLITAFLTIQWTTSHIHIAQQHDHDGLIHQHKAQTHAHQYVVSENLSFQTNHLNVIEFDSEFNLQNNKQQQSPSSDIALQVFSTFFSISLLTVEIPIFVNTEQGYSLYSSVSPRAPPLNA